MLKEVSHRLLACVRESDTVARLGGDEFTIILSELWVPDEVSNVAEKITSSGAKPFETEKEPTSLSLSVGIAVSPRDCNDVNTLLRNAVSAMYVSKKYWKGRHVFFRGGIGNTTVADKFARHCRLVANNPYVILPSSKG